MLSYEDICAMCDLTEEEVDCIARHEHVSNVIAAEIGAGLLKNASGRMLIYKMLCDDVQRANDGPRRRRAQLARDQFCRDHPDVSTLI